MKKRSAIILATLLSAISLLATNAERPNIVLLMSDDHGWEETSYNGHPYVKTPVMDEMAASGLRFDNFYSAFASCSPTRASFMTGRHPNRCATFYPGCSLRPEEITIAQLLSDAGYATAHFGKWHIGPVKASSPTSPGAMGFDEWVSHDNFFEMNPPLSRNGGDPVIFEGESSEVIVDEAIHFIDRSEASDKPFFAVVWFGSPHEPYSGYEEDLNLYNDLPERYSKQTVKLTSNETGYKVERPLRDVLRERYAEITAMDRAIGKLRDHLEEKGIRENTIFFYCSDNGIPPSGLRESIFRERKGSIYEGGTRVPAIIEWPERIQVPSATQVSAVTSDLLPTLCALLDIPLPNRPIDGINILPLLDGTMTTRPEPIYFWNWDYTNDPRTKPEPYIEKELQKGTTPLVKLGHGGRATRNFANQRFETIYPEDYTGTRAVVDGRHKLVLDKSGEQVELFDLHDDPGETINLATLRPDLVQQMRLGLEAWQASVLRSLLGLDYE